MPFPIIIVDSTSGSDTAASGAGPGDGTTAGSALTGTTNASTSGTGLVVTLPSGTVLTGVDTTGLHVLYLADSTTGNRNFSKITGTSGSGGSTPTVTVSDAFGVSLSGKSWAIGGKRASWLGANSVKLVENNSAAGDARPGWVIEMQSGHVETSGGINVRCSGDLATGPIIIRGKAGATTRPVVTFNGGIGIIVRGNSMTFLSFDQKDTSGHSGYCFNTTGQNNVIRDIHADDATSYPFNFAVNIGNSNRVIGCRAKCAGTCIVMTGGTTIEGNDLTSTGGKGVDATGIDPSGLRIVGNLIHGCGGHGIVLDCATATNNRSIDCSHNTVDSCGPGFDGIHILGFGDVFACLVFESNILSNNGGYALQFISASATDGALAGYQPIIRNNNTYGNSSGAYKSITSVYAYNACPWATGDPGANPIYASPSDWTPTNTALRAAFSVVGYS